MAVEGEAYRKAEEENCRLTDERLSLIMELGVSKDEFAAFQAKVTMEKKEIDEEFDTSGDVIFNYGYGCCAFAHNICGSKPLIPVGMPYTTKPLPPKFFLNPRCPPSASPDLLVVATIREEPLAKSSSTVDDGIDIPLEAPTRANEESSVAVEG